MGLYYFGKRYYDTEVGRWTSVDPRQQHDDAYLYGSNDPINRFDPDGGTDYPALNFDMFKNLMWQKASEEWQGYKQAAPLAAKDIGKATLVTAGVAVTLAAPEIVVPVARFAPAIIDATMSTVSTVGEAVYMTAAKNPGTIAATAELGKNIVGAIDPSSPPDNPREMFFNVIFDKVSDWLNKD